MAKYLVLVEKGLELTEENFSETDISQLDLDYFGQIKPSQITEYLSYVMDGRDNNERTRSRKLSSIKAFYKYFVNKIHKLEVNPAIDIETPKVKKSLPKYLSLNESMSLLRAVDLDEESSNRRRDYCILTLFLNCGMRLSELCGINERDFDRDITQLNVTGKGNKERIIYLNDACREAIKNYLPARAEAASRCKEVPKPLFLSRLNRRISPKTVQFIVKKYLDAAGLSLKGYSTHKLRHTAATLMYQTGEVDIRVLKDILGHEQLTTTQIYTHVSDRGMEQAMSKNPLAAVKSEYNPKAEKIGEKE